jgi:hypothetical protein
MHHHWLAYFLRWSLMFCLGWLRTMTLLIFASQVGGITGIHYTWIHNYFLLKHESMKLWKNLKNDIKHRNNFQDPLRHCQPSSIIAQTQQQGLCWFLRPQTHFFSGEDWGLKNHFNIFMTCFCTVISTIENNVEENCIGWR